MYLSHSGDFTHPRGLISKSGPLDFVIVSCKIFGPGWTDLFGKGISYYIYDAVLNSKEYGIREMRSNLFARLEKYKSTLTSFGCTNVNSTHGIKHAPRLPQSIGRKSSYSQQLSLKKPPISSFRSRTARKIFHLWYSTATTLRLQAQENYYSLKYRGILGVV